MQVRVARRSLTLALRHLLAPPPGAGAGFRVTRLHLRSRDALVSVEDGGTRLAVRLVPRDPRSVGPRDRPWSRHFLVLPEAEAARLDASAEALLRAVGDRLRAADLPPLVDLLALALGDGPVLTVPLPSQCEQACVFCRDAPRRGGWAFPRLDGRRRALAAARERLAAGRAGHGRVLFQGDDVLAQPALPELIRAADALGYEGIALLTPGARLADGALVERLVAAGLDTLEVPLYGGDAAGHDAITRVPGSFERLLAGLERARRADVHVIVHTALLAGVMEQLPAIARLCAALDLTFERAEAIAADRGQEARFCACAPPLGAVRAALAAAAPALPRPFTLVDLPDCALNPPLPGLVTTRRPPGDRRWPWRQAAPCDGCARRTACPGPSAALLAAHGAGDLRPFP